MSIFLKSNTSLQQKPLTGIAAQSVLYLDFTNQLFLKKGVKQSTIDNIIKTTASVSRGYYTPWLDYSVATGNTNVVSSDPDTLKKGLLIEAAATNVFKNSFNPVSHATTLHSQPAFFAVMQIVGSGSVSVSVDGILIGTATENNPVVYYPKSVSATLPVNFVVSGEVTYAEFIKTKSPRQKITKIKTIGSDVSTAPALVEINPITLNELLTGFSGCIVIKQYIPSSVFDVTKLQRQTLSLLSIVNNSDVGIFMSQGVNAPYNVAMRTNVGSDKVKSSDMIVGRTIITAVNFNKTSAKSAINGAIVGEEGFASTELSRITIGSSPIWSEADTSYVQEVLLFDRQLTDDELIEITKL